MQNKTVVYDASSSFQPITLGNVLGMGTFCKVQEITFASSHGQASLPSQRYVVKSLRRDENTIQESDSHQTALKDLQREAQLLSHLSGQEQHKNIIQLHAVITRPIHPNRHCNNKNNSENCFLILDRLDSTLREKIFQWNNQQKLTRFAKRRRTHISTVPSLGDRLSIGSDIASALQHLHTHGIMHRDIKPENIGFDADGQAKIFDLGFARKYNHNDMHMTGMIGTQRYMAPEIAKCAKHYDLSVDVYSFGLVLWELCAMERPFGECCSGGVQKFNQMVTYGGQRPCMSPDWSETLQSLLQGCWSDCPSERPGFGEILAVLSSDDITKNSDSQNMLSPKLRRSLHSPSGVHRRFMTLVQRS